MTVEEVSQTLNAQLLCGQDRKQEEVHSACGSDLMSDVLAFVKRDTVLLTGLTNPQVIRTAEMLDVMVIVFVRGKEVPQATLDLAVSKNMVLLSTDYTLFDACGRLYEAGLRGVDERI
jgi:predicted transcriptional regulator